MTDETKMPDKKYFCDLCKERTPYPSETWPNGSTCCAGRSPALYIRADLVSQNQPETEDKEGCVVKAGDKDEALRVALEALEIAIGYTALLAGGVGKIPIAQHRVKEDCDIIGKAIDQIEAVLEGK